MTLKISKGYPAETRKGRKVYFQHDVERTLEYSGAMPSVDQYGGHKGNYGNHCMSFGFMGIDFWFSYKTLIAFHVPGYEQVVMKNYWGPTTGRHLGQAAATCWSTERVEDTEFLVRLNNQLRGYLGVNKLTLPFLRLDADPKTLERSGYIGFCKSDEDEVPPPKPKKSDFYLHPKKQSRYEVQKIRREARELEQEAERRLDVQAIADEYGNQLKGVEAMI